MKFGFIAKHRGVWPVAWLDDPDTGVAGRPTCAIGEPTWFVGDTAAAHDFLLAGLGWAHMPLELVCSDLAARRLVELDAGPRGGGLAPLAFAMSSLEDGIIQ